MAGSVGCFRFPFEARSKKWNQLRDEHNDAVSSKRNKKNGMRVGQIKAKCTKMFGNSFDFDSSPKVNGNIFVDFSVYFCNVFVVVVVCFLMNCVLQLKICC